MERISSSGVRSESYSEEKLVIGGETYQFGEENLLQEAPAPEPETGGSSFTALLGLPANQAMELLHSPESDESPTMSAAEILTDRRNDQKNLSYSLNRSPPTFPSNSSHVERVARFSILAAAEDWPQTSSVPSNSSENSSRLKNEPTDSDSNPSPSSIFSDPMILNKNRRSVKRKGREIKVKTSAKKSKKVENESFKDGDKLPYVHVRARRGQATDSHSLAERARREKINARMKLLQELVPGCNKISGTALVLDEIISHVQSLQRQVEFLSTKLAAVNPRIDFSLESLLMADSGFLTSGNFPSTVMPSMWPEIQINGTRQQQQNQDQQLWHVDVLQQPLRGRDNNHNSITPESSLFSFNSASSASLPANQLKMEI